MVRGRGRRHPWRLHCPAHWRLLHAREHDEQYATNVGNASPRQVVTARNTEATGVRDATDLDRFVCQCRPKGPERRLGGPCILPDQHEEATWYTEAPPGTHPEACGRRPRHEGARGHQDRIGRPGDKWTATLPEDPYAPGRRKARTDHESRSLRLQKMLYCQRIFAPAGQRADMPWHIPQCILGSDDPRRITIQGWCPPEVHWPGQIRAAVATKASSSASSGSGLARDEGTAAPAPPSPAPSERTIYTTELDDYRCPNTTWGLIRDSPPRRTWSDDED